MSRLVNLAALQTHYGSDLQDNIDRTIVLIRQAASAGAQIILPSELFQGPYFCTTQDERWFATAYPALEHPCVTQLQPIAAEIGVVIPVSIFEREGPRPGYQEKYYFRPGDSGFKVWNTRYAKIGVGICWDQWYPEAARAMALLGAEVLFYPTAIGSEPHDGTLDTRDPWRRAMQGHAVSNIMPVVAANRIGVEQGLGDDQHFYGSSFIADHRGDLIADLSRTEEGIATGTIDLTFLDRHRAAWGFFRDRRPELYDLN